MNNFDRIVERELYYYFFFFVGQQRYELNEDEGGKRKKFFFFHRLPDELLVYELRKKGHGVGVAREKEEKRVWKGRVREWVVEMPVGRRE